MSRLWLTNWQTDRHGKVMQYSVWAESAIWAGRPSPIWGKPKRKGIFSATSSLLTSVKPSIIWRVLALLPAVFMYSIYCPPRCSALRKEGNCKAAQFPSFLPFKLILSNHISRVIKFKPSVGIPKFWPSLDFLVWEIMIFNSGELLQFLFRLCTAF